ncbi:hypothetical protein C8P63_106112 [Melghirimyces profundicolus]|uniref:Uncharacterized protein n=1 Tax=Melghirimyces profundicolus TaxID=1242148 RepID=A0A2T6C0M2_9BACL|nr:hypothetical protein [Melghirimyces profundicolus]PTX61860.1 hypothetical protein C8P63_106112 [Melghirimyces profundicolus]
MADLRERLQRPVLFSWNAQGITRIADLAYAEREEGPLLMD